jgi:4-amino-4-deoxy-L-arabinose transferase-like glycosyltransferase
MSALKLQTLKQKLWAIFAASFVARVIMFFILPNSPSSLAPDEGTYASLTKWIAESKPATDFPAYGEGLYLSGRSIIIPASALNRIGMGELDAVRLVASSYGLLSLILLTVLVLKLSERIEFQNKFNSRLIVACLFIYAFLPSHFVWSNLGLREAPNEFWVLCSLISIYTIFYLKAPRQFISYFALFVSVIMCFNTRPQVGWVLGISLLAALVIRIKQPKSLIAIVTVMCGVILGSTGTSVTSGNIIELTPGAVISMVDGVPNKQAGNQVDAASKIVSPNCPLSPNTVAATLPNRLGAYTCIIWRAPYMSSTFLFRPFIIGDITSKSSAVAAFENLFWLLTFGLIVFLSIKRRRIPRFNMLAPSLIFFALYVVGAGAYEGNMGTAFRHKSLILGVVLALVLSLLWRNSQPTDQNSRNKPTESAV